MALAEEASRSSLPGGSFGKGVLTFSIDSISGKYEGRISADGKQSGNRGREGRIYWR